MEHSKLGRKMLFNDSQLSHSGHYCKGGHLFEAGTASCLVRLSFTCLSLIKLSLRRILLYSGQLEPVPGMSVLESVHCANNL